MIAAEYVARLDFQDEPFYNGMRRAGTEWDSFTTRLQTGGQQASGVFSAMGVSTVALGSAIATMATQAISSLQSMAAGAVNAGFAFNSLKEQSTIAFTSFMGSANAARQHLQDLFKFAATTPFESAPLIKASQMLQAVGISGQQVIPIMTGLGNALSAMGNLSSDAINHVVKAITDMKSKGTVSLEELKRQLGNFIPAIKLIAENMGISQAQLLKRVEEGAISVDEVINNLVEGANKRFGNLMEQQSHTIQGLMSTLRDFFAMSMGELTSGAFEQTRNILQKVVDVLPSLQEGFRRAGEFIGSLITELGALRPLFDDITQIVNRNKNTWEDWANVIRGAVRGVVFLLRENFGFIVDAINRADKALRAFNMSVLDFATGAGALMSQLRRIPGLITGGGGGSGGGLFGQGGEEIFGVPGSRPAPFVGIEIADPSETIKKVGKKARAAVKEVWDGLNQETEAQVKKWISHQALGIDLSAKEWNRWPKELRDQLKAQARAFDDANNEMDLKMAKFVAAFGFGTDKILQRINDFAEKGGVKWKFTIEQMLRMNPELAAKLDDASMSFQQQAEAAEDAEARLAALKLLYPQMFPPLIQLTITNNDLAASYKNVEEQAKQVGAAMGAEFKKSVDEQTEAAKKLKKEYDELSRAIPDSINKIIDVFRAVGGKLSDAFLKDAIKIKGVFADIFGVVDALPGRVGDALRRATDEFDKWYRAIDSIVRLIERILGDESPEGLAGVLQSVIGIFKKTQDSVKDAEVSFEDLANTCGTSMGSVSASVEGAASSTESSSSRIVQAIGAIGASMAAVATIMNSPGGFRGAVSGAMSGMAAGASIGSLFGPAGAGWGALIGGAAGGILGLFGFGGPSEEEKRREEEKRKMEIERMKQDIQKGAQDVMQAALESFEKARQFLEGLADYTRLPKGVFKAFFKDLSRLMDEFVALSKKWKGEALDKTKALAEAMGPIVESIGAAVGSLSLMSGYPGVAKATIEQFFNDLEIAVTLFGEMAERLPDKLEKRAKKLGERLQSVIDVIGGAVLAFMGSDGQPGLKYYGGVPEEAFRMFEADLLLAVEMMGRIADRVDNTMVKAAQRFSEKVIHVAELIIKGMAGFMGSEQSLGLKDYAKIPVEVFDAFFADLLLAANKMAEIVTQIDSSILAKAELFSEKSIAVFKAIAEGVKAFKGLHDYKSIPAETMEAFVEDFERAIQLISLLMARVDDFTALAVAFEEKIIKAADHLTNGIAVFSSSIVDGLSQLNAAFGHINLQTFTSSGGGGASTVSGGSSLAASTFGGSSPITSTFVNTSSSLSAPRAATQVNINVTIPVQGSLIYQSQIVTEVKNAIKQLVRTGVLPIKGGGSVQFA